MHDAFSELFPFDVVIPILPLDHKSMPFEIDTQQLPNKVIVLIIQNINIIFSTIMSENFSTFLHTTWHILQEI